MAANENIKGITIQIGGDVQPLEQALEKAKDKSKTLAQELDALNKKLKLDPNNIEDLKKKFSILGQSIEESDKKVASLQEAWKQAREDFKAGKISQTEFDRITQEMKSAEKENVILNGQMDTLKKKLGELGYEIDDAGNIIQKTAEKADDAGEAVEDLGDTAEDAGDQIEDAGDKTDDTNDVLTDLSASSAVTAAAIVKLTEKILDLSQKMYEAWRESDSLLKKNDELHKSIEKSQKKYEDETREIENNGIALEIQLKKIKELDQTLKNESLTALDAKKKRDQLKLAVDAFNEACGESVFTINEETGALNENISVGTDFVKNVKQRAKAAAQYKRFIEIYTEITELEGTNAALKKKYEGEEEGFKAYYGNIYEKDIKKNKEKIETLQQEADYIEVLIGDYADYGTSTATASTSVQQLTDAEADRLIRAQANGYVLTEMEQQQLDQYRETHKGEIESLEWVVQKEAELLGQRVQQTTDTNSKIELNTKNSLKKRAQTIEHNTKMVNNYEQNLHELLLIALAQDDEDAKQAMLNYLNTLTDYSTDSMSIVQMMVDDFGKKGGEASWQLINGFKAANTTSQWSDVGVQIGKAAGGGVASGIKQSKTLVTNAATSLARAIEKQLEGVKVTYKVNPVTGIQRNGITIQAMAQGGIVTQPTYTLTGEAGPEAIIPLDRLGGIIESALGNSGGIGGGYTMNVYPQSMSPSEQEMLLDKFDRRFGDRTSRRAI